MTEQLYTQEQIVHHVENASPTKFMYSFGRSERFPPIKRTGKSDTFYNLPSTIMRRTAGFGFGKKSDFTKGSSAGVHTEFVSIKRDFDKGSQPGYKYSFGLSRDKFGKAVCPGYKNIDKNIPGPGKYYTMKKTGSESPSYSLHIKCGENGWTNERMKNPGPGAYTPYSINPEGRYPISRIPNVSSLNFGLSHSLKLGTYKGKNFFLFFVYFYI